LPVTVLSDYREKGKTYPNQPRLFLTCKTAPLSGKRQGLPYIKPSNYHLVFVLYPVKCLSIARNPLALLIVWTSPLAAYRGIPKNKVNLARE